MVRKEIIEIYKFEELNKDSKEKAIENQREIQDNNQLDLDWWQENLIEEIENKGFYNTELRYSLSYCQGDGFSFIGKLDLMKFLKINKIKTRFKKLHKLIEEEEICLEMNKNFFATHYMHSNTINLDLSCYYVDLTETQLELKDELEEIIQEIYNDFCKRSETEGYKIIEYERSNENLKELIEINDYEFLKTGELY